MPKHIVRLIALLAGGLALGLVAKWYFTAESFYEYGHYRADSVPEIAAQEPAFQGAGYCQACHSERHAQWSANNHKSVTCEVCHGAAQGHPQNGKLPIPADTRKLCTLCHEEMAERPRTQPQIASAQHGAGQQCIVCHNPHAPKLGGRRGHGRRRCRGGRQEARGKLRELPRRARHQPERHLAESRRPERRLSGPDPRRLQVRRADRRDDVARGANAQRRRHSEPRGLLRGLELPGARARCGCRRRRRQAAGQELRGLPRRDRHRSNPAWPQLAGQKATYLANALKAFRAGLRKDPMMAGVVRGLSDADIANLAAYYAAQSCGPASKGKGGP